MKICAIVCEYNPFHNGHKYLIEQAKRLTGCDRVLCIMSASFTQRGEPAIIDKFTRAKHAVLGGADCAIQLPVCFSVAPAEIFALGAVKILSTLPDVKYLAFGCENADKNTILRTARILCDENQDFKTTLKAELEKGNSYKNAMQTALEVCGGDSAFLGSPNNTLAAEYTKAILKCGADIEIIPIQRQGAGYADERLKDNYSSANAIRANLADERIKENIPEFVFADIKNVAPQTIAEERLSSLARYALERSKKDELTKIFGCSEGLENALKARAALPLDKIIEECSGKRYTAARIRRIITANMLGLSAELTLSALESVPYIKPLAVKKSYADEIMRALSLSSAPVIIKQNSMQNLSEHAKAIYERDAFADFTRDLICGGYLYDFMMLTV